MATEQEYIAFLDREGAKGKKREEAIRLFRRQRLTQKIEEERAAQAGSTMRSVAGHAGAAGLHAVSGATGGYLSRLTAAVERPQMPHAAMGPLGMFSQALMADAPTEGVGGNIEEALRVSEETNPISSTVGEIGGVLAPSSAIGKGFGLLGSGISKATGLSKLTQLASTKGIAARTGAHFLQNLVSGVGVNTAARIAEARSDDASLGVRLSQALDDVSTPGGAALFGGSALVGGAIAGRMHKPIDRDLAPMIRRFEQVTGRKVPVDTLTNARGLQEFMDSVSKMPGMADEVAKVQKSMKAGVLEMIAEARKNAGAATGPNVGSKAAAGARRLSGAGRETGAITKLRRSGEAQAMGPLKKDVLQPKLIDSMRRGLAHLRKTRPRMEAAGAIDDIATRMDELLATGNLHFDDFEAVRRATAKMAFPANAMEAMDPRISTRARYEAGRFYKLLSAARQRYYPTVDQAMQTAEKLRRLEEVLPMERVQRIDDVTMRRFLSGGGAPKRVGALLQHGTADEIAAAKGWLFNEAMSAAGKADGLSTSAKVEKAFRGSGALNHQTVDALLPGFRREMTDLAKLTDVMFGKGVMEPKGAPTMGRLLRAGLIITAPVAAVNFGLSFLEDPFSSTVGHSLGTLGAAYATHLLAKSSVRGSMKNIMQDLARGKARPMVRTPVALRQAGAIGPLQNLMGPPEVPVEEAP